MTTPSDRRERIAYHLQRAEMHLLETERAQSDTAVMIRAQLASAHSLQARALQEEERLDGCTRHHGQARP